MHVMTMPIDPLQISNSASTAYCSLLRHPQSLPPEHKTRLSYDGQGNTVTAAVASAQRSAHLSDNKAYIGVNTEEDANAVYLHL